MDLISIPYPMASPEDVESAIAKLREIQAPWGKPGTRMHQTGLLVANTLRNALEHACCRNCSNLDIEPTHIDGKDSVNLFCGKRHSPQKLWSDWTPDEEPITCPDCTDPAGRPPTTVSE